MNRYGWMALLGAALVGAASSCAAGPAPVEPTLPELEPASSDRWGPQSPQHPWWNDEPACPDGATIVGAFPPDGNVVECMLPEGLRHGSSSVWFPNGHEGTFTEYARGVRHGDFLHWLHGRKLIEGQFENGRRHGEWVYWFDEMSDWDSQSRLERSQPVVIELYDHGMILRTDRHGEGVIEELHPERTHDRPPPKTASE